MNLAFLTLSSAYVKGGPLKVLSPVIESFELIEYPREGIKEGHVRQPLIGFMLGRSFIAPRVLLKRMNFKAASSPQLIKRERVLSEDASNLANVLHTVYMERGEVPGRVRAALSAVFGEDVAVKPELTEDGRVYIKVLERGFELKPPMVADGLWRLLAIMLAVEARPALLLIDELENSLHPEAIEYVVSELRDSGCVVIAATHSPVVVDAARPEELVLVEKDEEGATKVRRVKSPKAVKRWMAKHGITLSEGWLYGRL